MVYRNRHILSLLQGTCNASSYLLEQLRGKIAGNNNVCWYPSSGSDFRDILELGTSVRRSIHKLEQEPLLYIHTDYSRHLPFTGIVYKDDRTEAEVIRSFRLKIKVAVNYHVNDEYVTDPEISYSRPSISLLMIRIKSTVLGVVTRPVLYFHFENINFFNEIILRHGINISHMVKVREGNGFGGNRKSISWMYPLAKNIGINYMIIDDHVDEDDELVRSVSTRYNIRAQDYQMMPLSKINNWSGFKVQVLRLDGYRTNQVS